MTSKENYDFGWKKWRSIPIYANLALKHQKGDVLDAGCATCELYTYFTKKGWKGNYYGIDIKKYEEYDYPNGVNLVIGNVMDLKFPKVDTVILYNILEHVEDPSALLKKSIDSCKKNVLIYIPKRNEELWKYGIVEHHQLDKTHKNCGFSKKEIYYLVNSNSGKIINFKEFWEVNPAYAIGMWDNKTIRLSIYTLRKFFSLIAKIFSIKTFYQEMWLEAIPK